ncbi:hypothetical protein [Flavobacterium tegetincola]|uniref:hypothetical protein n=1 Tax=Flavobacterium tegetincola TaxID=150172 RepID=UPI0004007698|nr:hypothetical protein [Flavobacterium tegetincola]
MTEKDKKFIAHWENEIEKGQLQYHLKIIVFTCLVSTAVIVGYTWGNIPENKFFESLAPLSILIFALGIPLGIVFAWQFWSRNNNRYKFLTTGNELLINKEKKKWFERDKIWDVLASNIGAVYFLLLYTSIFLFDSGNPSAIKYGIVFTILSYLITLFVYIVYRYFADKSGETKKFPLFFKIAFPSIILLTIILWFVIFYKA